MSIPEYTDVVLALCQEVVGNPGLRVGGPTEAYRCKATYSLVPGLQTSPLAMHQVNAMCEAVAEFVRERSRVAAHFQRFYFEVCGKYSRRGDALLKIVFVNQWATDNERTLLGITSPALPTTESTQRPLSLFSLWMLTEEPVLLVQHLQTRIPNLVAVVAHVRLLEQMDASDGGRYPQGKPDKCCAYIPLTEDKADTITEYTPNGFPFVLSADSFCEVNHPMEDAIFTAIVEYLRLDDAAFGGAAARRAFMTGRDINSVYKTFEGYYASVSLASSCSRVVQDATRNGIPGCHYAAKDQLCHVLRSELQRDAVGRRLDVVEEVHILITAGRHGLHPSTSHELVRLANREDVTDLLYVSCNVVSFARDLYVLKEGFRVHHARSFDFFPGTDYTMTVVHARPLRLEESGSLLVLPVGLPGVGKSTCGRALTEFFARSSGKAQSVSLAEGRGGFLGRPRCGGGGESVIACVPRHYSPVACGVVVRLVERDATFHALREAGCSLKRAKEDTHSALLSALQQSDTGTAPPIDQTGEFWRRTVVYMDSTNGSVKGRQLYRDTWAIAGHHEATQRDQATASSSGSDDAAWLQGPCVELVFRPVPLEQLLERVRMRPHHPSFPRDEAKQLEKMNSIAKGICTSATVVPWCVVAVGTGASELEERTVTQGIMAVVGHLLLSRQLARVCVGGATNRLEALMLQL